MSLGDETHEGQANGLVLALDHLGDVVDDGVEALGERLDGAGSHPLPGHRPSLLSAPVNVALAVDVGGTKMAAGLVTAEGELVTSAASPTPLDVDAESLFSVVLALCDSVGGDG